MFVSWVRIVCIVHMCVHMAFNFVFIFHQKYSICTESPKQILLQNDGRIQHHDITIIYAYIYPTYYMNLITRGLLDAENESLTRKKALMSVENFIHP